MRNHKVLLVFLVACMTFQPWIFSQASEAFPFVAVLRKVPDLLDDAFVLLGKSKLIRVTGKSLCAIGKSKELVPDHMIAKLASMTVKEAGKVLGKMHLSMEALEDVYLRILIKQNKISLRQAEGLVKNLGGVDGFSSTLRKISSSNAAQATGHLFELRIAEAAKKKGYSIVAIGKKFADPAKGGLTDADLIIRKNGKQYFVEAKSYGDVSWSSLPNFRADMDSLQEASKAFGSGEKIFIISNKPSNAEVCRALEEAARSRNVKLLFGAPERVLEVI